MNTKKIIIALGLIAAFGLIVYLWQQSKKTPVPTKSETNVNAPVQKTEAETSQPSAQNVKPSYAQTPTDAYKLLYEAVKAKNTEDIKSVLSKKTLTLAEGVSAQQNKGLSQVYENGFTSTTFAPNLPKIRDERVKDEMGAIEVWSEKDQRWEDLPFVKEDGGWKLAIGDIFAGTYKSPGRGQSQIESETSNSNTAAPFGSNSGIPVPPRTSDKSSKSNK